MARHRLSPLRVPFLARARRPALLGGALGGGAALVIGVVSCVLLSTTSVGVHFTFADRAAAAVVGAPHHQPAVTRDLATAATGSPTPQSTPSRNAVAATTSRTQGAAASPVSPLATPPAASSAAAPAAPAASAAIPSPSPSASPSVAPTPSPAASAPAQEPSSQPTAPTAGGDDCVLAILCL
jgi:hypothetical protein